MFLLQLKFETLRLLRSPILWLLLVLLVGSVGFGIYNGVQRTNAIRQSVGQMLDNQRKELEQQKMQADSVARNLKKVNRWWLDPTNVIVVGGLWKGGWLTAVDPAPQSIIAVGVSDLHPNAYRMTLFGKEPRGDNEFENPVNLTFGAFDLAFVLAFLLPLLVIALSFNLISGEREQGTLALQWAQPVASRALFFQKMLARFVLLAGLTTLITLPAMLWAGISPTSAAAWQVAGIAVLYSLFWFLVSLGVNLLGGSSAQNALICIGVWLLFTLIVPALVNMLAEKIHPVPSRAGYLNALRELNNQLEESRETRLNEFYKQNPNIIRKSDEQKDWDDWYREDFALFKGEKLLMDSIEQFYESKGAAQSVFAEGLTVLSPTLSIYRQLTDLAGTSRRAFRGTEDVLNRAQKNWADWFLKKFDAGQSLTVADYDEFMRFPDKVSSASIEVSKSGIFWLLLQCLLAGAWAWWIGRKQSLTHAR